MDQISNLTYANASIGAQYVVLQEILKPSKNIAIQQRDISFLKEELGLIMSAEVEFRKTGTTTEIFSALQEYVKQNFGSCPNFLSDASGQISHFQKISGAETFRLFFKTVTTNMCRRFHTDINSLRMLCTYVGQGTMWIPDEFVNSKAYHSRGGNDQIVLDENHIQQVDAGDVIILKGALYPDANPIVHRSPTIEGSGESRLLLRVDVNDALSF